MGRQCGAGLSKASMAGPGDNSRATSRRPAVEADSFKRAVPVCMRAIAGDNELEVGFAKDRPALAGNRARLPELPKKPSKADIAITRGLGNSMALKRACHDSRIHTKLAPEGKQARAIYDAVEQARVEAIGCARHAGRRRQYRLDARGQIRQGQSRRRQGQGRRADRGSAGADGAREADRPRRARRAASGWSISGGPGSRKRPAPTSTACRQARRPAGLRPRRARHAGLHGDGRGTRRRPGERRDRGQ